VTLTALLARRTNAIIAHRVAPLQLAGFEHRRGSGQLQIANDKLTANASGPEAVSNMPEGQRTRCLKK